ncbi:MAG TPA: 2-amino-4-hydroxy-6-hydroxymethyldihydropteridine diphosphokinase [Thermoanaerobaculia bacterium]|nr:2-amino-4-hydroxy-6-hydroxymethyldihydropteridine diphosphokinase [Thermoanaerobaculia bacterium]
MASSKRSTALARSWGPISRARRTIATSSLTRSTSRTRSVVIALGSSLGPRRLQLRRALRALSPSVRLVKVSSVHETEPVDAPAGSPPFLNMVVAGHTTLAPEALLEELQRIERTLGRRRTARNAPRTIDLDLILHGATVMRTPRLTLPHPRYRQRGFVMNPLRELNLPWAAQ